MPNYDKIKRKEGRGQQASKPSPASTPPSQLRAAAPSAPALAALPVAARLRSMDQERAEFALRKIQEFTAHPVKSQAEVRRYLNGLPALIRMNGLGQALAFYRMQGPESTHSKIVSMLGEWLCAPGSKGRVFVIENDEAGNNDVLRAITRSDVHAYMAAQNEALALLEWMKKFALALLKKKEEGETN